MDIIEAERSPRHEPAAGTASATGLETKACHLGRLWVRHNGDLHCCYRWSEPDMRIAHIDDADLMSAIRGFSHPCSCERYRLREAAPGEALSVDELVIEVSLACQGECAFCCVRADEWKGDYERFDSLTKVIDLLNPKTIVVQGGEVLIQKRTLAWLEGIRDARPHLRISLITNGNVSVGMAGAVERIFDEVKVSVFGFEPATYERISGMELAGVVRFVEELASRKKVELVLKYVVSPLSFHEADLFLDWAIDVRPSYVFFEDVGTMAYLNTETPDGFWTKMSERTGRKVASVLRRRGERLRGGDMTVQFSSKSLEVLGLGVGFRRLLEAEGLLQKVVVYWAVGETPLQKTEPRPGLRARVVRTLRRFLPRDVA
ncbi:MAG: radical SAM protein [Thermoanaerobaculaceae bacterium]|jgi:pyruvate-formate lyase-activating enzyme|nr:radical SAM protein [Thermoanaerobaculaceae bacterium]